MQWLISGYALAFGVVPIIAGRLGDDHGRRRMLLIGSVVGAQLGARFAQKMKPEYLRLALAVIVLLVAIRMGIGLTIRPGEIYTVQPG